MTDERIWKCPNEDVGNGQHFAHQLERHFSRDGKLHSAKIFCAKCQRIYKMESVGFD